MSASEQPTIARLRTGARASVRRLRAMRPADLRRLAPRGGRDWRTGRLRIAAVPAAMLVGLATVLGPWTAVLLARSADPVLGVGTVAGDPWSLQSAAWGAWSLTGLLVAAVIALVAWARLRLPAPDLSRTAIAGIVTLAGYAALCAASVWLWSPSPSGAWQWTVIALAAVVATLLGAFAGAQAEGRRGLVLGVLVTGVATALIGIVDLLAWPDGARRLVSPFEPSANGLLIGLGLLAALAVDQTEHPQRRRWLRAAATLLFAALVLSASRSAIAVTLAGAAILVLRGSAITWPLLQAALGALPALVTALLSGGVARAGAGDDTARIVTVALLALGAALVAWNGARDVGAPGGLQRVARDRRALAGIAVGLVVLVVGLAASGEGGVKGSWERTSDAFAERSQPGRPGDASRLWSGTSDGRLWRWQAALDDFRQHERRQALLGRGPGSSRQLLRRYRTDGGGPLTVPSAPLAVLTQAGAIGLALVLVTVLALALAARRERRHAPQSDSAVLLTIGSVVVLHALFNETHLQPLAVLPAFAAIGAIVARPSVEQRLAPAPATNAPPIGRSVATAFGAALAVLAMLAAIAPARAQLKAREAEVATTRGDAASLRDAVLFASQARELDPNAYEGYAVGSQAALAQGRWAEARRLAIEAVRRAPDEAAAWRALGFVTLAEHDRPGARRAARRLQRLDPAAPSTREIAEAATLDSAPPEASPTAVGTPLTAAR